MSSMRNEIVIIDDDDDDLPIVIHDSSEEEEEIREYDVPAAFQSSFIDDPPPRTETQPVARFQPLRLDLTFSPLSESRTQRVSLSIRSCLPQTFGQSSDVNITMGPIKSISLSHDNSSRPNALSDEAPIRMSRANPHASAKGPRLGSSVQPIDVEDCLGLNIKHERPSDPFDGGGKGRIVSKSDPTKFPGRSLGGQIDEPVLGDQVLIDLDELEEREDLWQNDPALQNLYVEQKKASVSAIAQRNPLILGPAKLLPVYDYKGMRLRPGKTVELWDNNNPANNCLTVCADFLLITEIIENDGNVRLRGHLLQRCRSMNGLLEKKLNEVCFFQEIDLDDQRPREVQCVKEVSILEVKRLRSLRKTNQVFPNARNLDRTLFDIPADCEREGGLTARWRYTCTYATAADRWNNNHSERSLELLDAGESTNQHSISDTLNRIHWRGETTRGGSYRLGLDDQKWNREEREKSIISLASTGPDAEADYLPLRAHEPHKSMPDRVRTMSTTYKPPPAGSLAPGKRKSMVRNENIRNDSRKEAKRVRLSLENRGDVENIKWDLSRLSVEPQIATTSRSGSMDSSHDLSCRQIRHKGLAKKTATSFGRKIFCSRNLTDDSSPRQQLQEVFATWELRFPTPSTQFRVPFQLSLPETVATSVPDVMDLTTDLLPHLNRYDSRPKMIERSSSTQSRMLDTSTNQKEATPSRSGSIDLIVDAPASHTTPISLIGQPQRSFQSETPKVTLAFATQPRNGPNKSISSIIGLSTSSPTAARTGSSSQNKLLTTSPQTSESIALERAPTKGMKKRSRSQATQASSEAISPGRVHGTMTSYLGSRTIDLSTSDISNPPPSGVIRSSAIDLSPIARAPGQQYTYGDAFCGAGGSSRGASMAGLKILWGFDSWSNACATWAANFPTARCYELSSQDFVSHAQGSPTQKPVNMKVDILHLSPPCQYFSPAHTVECKADEMNIAALYAVGPVIRVARPRVVTLEQTFGLVAVRFRMYFNSLIHMFTALSFSVRWAVVPLAQWGLAQRRYRLIVIASCPGEILPQIPSATHFDPTLSSFPTQSLPPFTSVNSSIRHIRPQGADPDHDIPHLLSLWTNKPQPPWDGDLICPRTITTHGANSHPSGKRNFSLKEYAALQGFPDVHRFEGTNKSKQIGNAVPPVIAKVLFGSVRRELERADGVVGGETVVLD